MTHDQVEYRPVPGVDWVVIGSDRSVWIRKPPGAVRGRPVVRRRRPDGRRETRSLAGLYRAAFPPPPPKPKPPRLPYNRHGINVGSANGRHRLTESQVSEARRLRAAGWLLREIGARFGVHSETIGYAVRGRTWAHLDAPPTAPPGRLPRRMRGAPRPAADA